MSLAGQRTNRSAAGLACRLGGVSCAALGGGALIGWLVGVPMLVSIGDGLIPMAPSTAVLFLLHGLILNLRAGPDPDSRARLAARVASVGALALGALFVALAAFDLHLPIEHLGLSISGHVAGAPVGHMSLVTATCFALAGGAASATTAAGWPDNRGLRAAAFSATTILLATAVVFLLAYLYGQPLLYGGSIIPPALNTALGFVILGATYFVLIVDSDAPSRALVRRAPHLAALVGGFAVLAAAVVTVGHFSLQDYEEQLRHPSQHHAAASTDGPLAPSPELSGDGGARETWGDALLRRRLWEIALVTVALLGGLAALFAVFWYRHTLELQLERLRVTDALQASEAKFRTLFDQTSDGILIADLETRAFRYANPAAARLLGYTEAELCSMSVPDIHPKESLPHVLAEFVSVTRGDKAMSVDIPCLRKDGAVIYVDINTAEIVMDGRRASAGFFRNVTDRKHAQEVAAKLEGQLRTSQKMEAIGSLAGGIAHDFNNLLSVVLTYSAMILQELPAADPKRADIEEIHKAGTRAAELTRQLLAFSRRQVLQPRIVDLNDVVTGIERMLRRLIGENIQLIRKTPADLGKVRVDPTQMDQVIINLAVNGRDAMPNGGTLILETADVELGEAYARDHVGIVPGKYVMLAVTDTGVGMDKAVLARIFEPFFTTKEKDKGTGLGLATIFGIVKQSGGSIWVYSEPGKGSTFKVYLPRVDGAASADLGPQRAPGSLRGTETILLVEDEEQVRILAHKILTAQGYRVIEARNGNEALQASADHPEKIDLLVTDVIMPNMSGPQLVEKLAATRPEMRILFMSGYTENAVVHHGVSDATFAFVQKPVTPESLASRVRQVIDAPVRAATPPSS